MTFTIPGKPQGKARPRFGNGRAYTPPRTKEYESLVRQCYIAQGGARQHFGYVDVKIVAFFRSRGKDGWCVTKPDADNIAKIVCDALNGFAYADDSQVVKLYVEKRYGEDEKVEVTINDAGLFSDLPGVRA